MPDDAGSSTYSLREPFERAVKSVCSALANQGLKMAGQLDVSRRIERKLGIALPPCRIVFVLPEPSVLRTACAHPLATTFLPLHVVITGDRAETEIRLQNRVRVGPEAAAQPFTATVMKTQAQILQAIEGIAARPSMVV